MSILVYVVVYVVKLFFGHQVKESSRAELILVFTFILEEVVALFQESWEFEFNWVCEEDGRDIEYVDIYLLGKFSWYH